MEILTLDANGVVVALAMGALLIVLGGALWYFFLGVMLLFLVLSAVVTRIGQNYKRKRGLGQDPRGLNNVMANGIAPLALVFLYRIAVMFSAYRYELIIVVGFAASVAAITADKFASEVGMLDGQPIMLIGLKKAKKGMSGAVTWLGLLASLIAAAIVSLSLFLVWHMFFSLGVTAVLAFSIAMISGFLGNLVDSLSGYYEEKGIGNKYTSNALCSVAGAIISAVIIAVIS